jgi:hypothetical protein
MAVCIADCCGSLCPLNVTKGGLVLSDNKCTAAIESFREVLRDKMCTSRGGCLITPLDRI